MNIQEVIDCHSAELQTLKDKPASFDRIVEMTARHYEELVTFSNQQRNDYEEVLKDHRRIVREIDGLINRGKPAAQAALIDLIPQITELVRLTDLAHPALRELCARIEKCGASPELTNAVTLCSDLCSAIGNEWNQRDRQAEDRVRAELAKKSS